MLHLMCIYNVFVLIHSMMRVVHVYSCDGLYKCYNSHVIPYTCFYRERESESVCVGQTPISSSERGFYCKGIVPKHFLWPQILDSPQTTSCCQPQCFLSWRITSATSHPPTSFLSLCLHLPLPLSSSFITFSPELISAFFFF